MNSRTHNNSMCALKFMKSHVFNYRTTSGPYTTTTTGPSSLIIVPGFRSLPIYGDMFYHPTFN